MNNSPTYGCKLPSARRRRSALSQRKTLLHGEGNPRVILRPQRSRPMPCLCLPAHGCYQAGRALPPASSRLPAAQMHP
ncbi:hypothetical protein Y1Q_0012774 [Alligator mississippiensis]|uniref:Uncharacterized protein n=1 Tax=Alligator mississippiensis TaxID=8496 RepID=A0A151M190_ALLMI|nr:hypothetical protein Y1Q_0012774 [Alligator mississippiensis]